MRRQWLLALLGVGTLFALTAYWQRGDRGHTAASGAVQAQTAAPIDTFRLVWSQPNTLLHSAALSADGQAITTVSTHGRIELWDWAQRPYQPLWSRSVPGVTRTGVSLGGRNVLAYTRLDPTRPQLFLLGAGGKLTSRVALNGAIWDAALSPLGHYVGVTTGPTDAHADSHSLFLIALTTHPVLHPLPLIGIGDSLSWSSSADGLAVGTWDNSGVTDYSKLGVVRWRYPKQSLHPLANRLFDVQMAQGGQSVLGISFANVHRGDATLYDWDGRSGQLTWKYALGPNALDPEALMSENGQRVAVTFTQLVARDDQNVTERRLVVLDGQGKPLWEKGGLLFAPTLVSIAVDGHRVTVSDGRRTLYHLDESGRITAPYAFHSNIRKTISTPDGRWLLAYTSDGMLNLLRLR